MATKKSWLSKMKYSTMKIKNASHNMYLYKIMKELCLDLCYWVSLYVKFNKIKSFWIENWLCAISFSFLDREDNFATLRAGNLQFNILFRLFSTIIILQYLSASRFMLVIKILQSHLVTRMWPRKYTKRLSNVFGFVWYVRVQLRQT